MNKKLLLFFSLLFFVSNGFAITNITDCGTISSNDTYNLTQNISDSSDCIVIEANNVVFDCNNYTVTFAGEFTSAFISDGYDNITIKNCFITQNVSDSNTSRPFTISNSDNLVITNTIVKNHGFEAGTDFEYLTNFNVSYNNFNCSVGDTIWCLQCYNCNKTIIHDNEIYTSGSSNGLGVHVYADIENHYGIEVYNNSIITDCTNCHGLKIQNVDDYEIDNNVINVVGSGSRGIYLIENENSNVTFNNITSEDYGIYLLQYNSGFACSNNFIGYNIINATNDNAIGLRSFTPYTNIYDYNVIEGNTIIDNGFNQLLVLSYWNNTNIKDQNIFDYDFSDSLLSFENSSYGLVNFTSIITETGDNLIGYADSDIVFGNNSVWVNSSISGFNKSANITLYNVGDRGFVYPTILKDGVPCADCVNYTSLEATNVLFSVTGWSNYSIGEGIILTPPNMFSGAYTQLGVDVSGFLDAIVPYIILVVVGMGIAGGIVMLFKGKGLFGGLK